MPIRIPQPVPESRLRYDGVVSFMVSHPQAGDLRSASATAAKLRWLFHPLVAVLISMVCSGFVNLAQLYLAIQVTHARPGENARWATLARVSMLMLPVALVGAIFAAAAEASWLIAVPIVAGVLACFGTVIGLLAHLREFTFAGSAPRKRLGQLLQIGVALPALTGLLFLLSAPLGEPLLIAGFISMAVTMLVCNLLMPWWTVQLVEGLWTLPESPDDVAAIAAVWLERAYPGLTIEQHWGRIEMDGIISGVPVRAVVDLDRAPGRMVVEIPDTGLPTLLSLRARRDSDGPGTGDRLSDMLLSELLVAEVPAGVDPDALLEGLHDDVLSVLHAHPTSTLQQGMLRVQIDDLARVTPSPDGEPAAQLIVQHIVDHIHDAVRLVSALQERLPHTSASAAQRRGARLPEMLTPR